MEHHKIRAEKKTDVKNGVERLLFVALAVVLQIWWVYILFAWIDGYSAIANIVMQIIALGIVLYIYGRHTNAAMKLPWVILIQVFPLLGSVMYFLMGRKGANRFMRRRFARIEGQVMSLLQQDETVLDKLQKENTDISGISYYLWKSCGFPAFSGSDATYYSDTTDALEALLEALRSAKKYIFMEYHAIEDAEAFGRIHAVLKQKAAEGVDVRLFYDDVGSIFFINNDFAKRMEADGIRCRVFNPVMPFVVIFMNNRDHRKITVVDGKVAFTGGYNLANEYFHLTEPYGYWKDTGVRLTGDCVQSFTAMFLVMWNAIRENDADDADFEPYMQKTTPDGNPRGYIQPYGDSPLDDEHTGENVYMNILNRATKYAWFVTPYLIITDELQRAFALAAKRGVDVRIITPGIPDKKLTYAMTRSYYAGLVQSGVKIYEYTPGFCHAKMCVSDDQVATCGTINLDYRSLYHHFENGVLFMEHPVVTDIRNDFETMFAQSQEVSDAYRSGISIPRRMLRCVLRLFAPLL